MNNCYSFGKTIVTAIAAVIVVIFLSRCKDRARLTNKEAKAVTQVRYISVALRALFRDNPKTEVLGKSHRGLIHADKVIISLAFIEQPVHSSGDFEDSLYLDWPNPKKLSDPWGNQYWIAWDEEIADPIQIFVWSNGANGLNEFGRGDDIWALNETGMDWKGGQSTLLNSYRKHLSK